MSTLVRHDCLNHPLREAVARCPGCHRFFCRECVSEHDGRMICSPCLSAIVLKPESTSPSRLKPLAGWVLASFCFVFLWILFYCLGRLLSSLPTSFHDNLLQ